MGSDSAVKTREEERRRRKTIKWMNFEHLYSVLCCLMTSIMVLGWDTALACWLLLAFTRRLHRLFYGASGRMFGSVKGSHAQEP